MSNIPITYERENIIMSSCNPSGVTVGNTQLAYFFRRYLLQKAMSVFRWKFPDDWYQTGGADYFLYTLFCRGSIAIIETDKFGVIPQGGYPYGKNVFYQPLKYSIANPLLRGLVTPQIGTECVVFKMTKDWAGIMDAVCFYADLMTLAAEACGVNLMNSKLSYVFTASDKATAAGFEKAMDNLLSGKPFTVVDSALAKNGGKVTADLLLQNLSANFIAPDLLAVLSTLENEFCTMFGIPNANTDKRERLITAEVDANNVETISTVDDWMEGWQRSCDAARTMFGVEISVDWRYKPPMVADGGVDDAAG